MVFKTEWWEELKELRKYKEKYRWHNVKEHPDDLPNGNYPKGVLFDVILFKIKNSPTRLHINSTMQQRAWSKLRKGKPIKTQMGWRKNDYYI